MRIEKWNRYVHPEVNEFSATTQWESAQAQGLDLMQHIPSGVQRVLDLGCGDGWSVQTLRDKGFDATGVTINPREAEHAKGRYNLDLLVMDMHDLDLADHSFDCVYCRECFEHSVAPYLALCEINRVLRPKGLALVHVPGPDWIKFDAHFSVLNDAQMREMFRKCHFDVLATGDTVVGRWYLGEKAKDI